MSLPYSLEQDLFARKNQALALMQQGASVDAMTVSRLLNISNTWTDLKPGAALPFAMAGYDSTSPQVRQAAQLSMAQNVNQQDWFKHLGTLDNTTPAPKTPRLKQYSQDDINKQEKAQHPDPEFVVQALLPKWAKLQDRIQKGDVSSQQLETNTRLEKGLQYAALQLDDHHLSTIADELGLSGSAKKALQTVASTGRQEHDLGGADISGIPYAGPALGAFRDAIKPAVREAAAVANAPLQGLQGSIRNIAGGGNFLFSASGATAGQQTDIGQQFDNLLNNKTLDIGNGYLPDPRSPVGQQTLAVQKAAAPTIGGHAFTLGRAAANQIFEPDTNAFNVLSGIVDAGVAFAGDPTSKLIGGLGEVRQAGKTFEPQTINPIAEATGAMPTTTAPAVVQNTKLNYLMGDDFKSTASQLMDIAQGSPSRMMRVINNSNLAAPTFPITTVHGQPLIAELAEASKTGDLEAFRTALAKATEVQAPLQAPGVTYNFRQGADMRIFANMPIGTIADPYDKNANWKILDDVMRGGGVPVADRDKALDIYLNDPNPMAGIHAVSDTIEQRLIHQYGIDPKEAHIKASFFRDANTIARAYDIDQATGLERDRPGIGIAGEGHPIPAPSLLTEGLNSPIVIPDMRVLRRTASDMNFITNTKPWEVSQTMLAFPSQVWKAVTLPSVRMMTRIMGESQLNLATRGSINAFTSPLDFINLLIGTNQDKRWATFLEKLPGLHASHFLSADGRQILDDSDNLLMHSASFIHDPETLATKGFFGVPPTHPDAGSALVEQLGRMHGDPIMRGVAQAENPEAAKEWFWNGAGKEARLARAPITANQDAWGANQLGAGKLTDYKPVGDLVNDRAAADRYIDEVMYPKLVDMTGNGHPELLDAVRTGKLNGRTMYDLSGGANQGIVDEKSAEYAKQLLDSGAGPRNSIPLRETIHSNVGVTAGHYARVVMDGLFHGLVDLPDKIIDRQPTLAPLKWEYVERNAPYLRDQDELNQVIDMAEKVNLPKDQLARFRAIKLDQTASDRLTTGQLIQLSKVYASDEARHVLHDLTSRSHFFDMFRWLVPFGDAFRLVAGRMLKLVADEPQVIRRLQQGLQEAKQPGSATINRVLGDPIDPNEGFFHTDPRTGEQVWTFPGSGIVTNGILNAATGAGVPIPLEGQVQGLNMLASGYPGFGGPALTVGAKWLLPDTPTGKAIKDVIFPAGNSESQGLAADIGGAFIPSFLGKLAEGAPNVKAMASATSYMLRALASTGKYDLHDPQDVGRLAKDAKNDARWAYVIQGGAQFLSPGAPSFDWRAKDKDGTWARAYALTNAYQKHVTKDGPAKAMQWLINTMGTDNVFISQGSSQSTGYRIPATKEAQAFVDAHPGIADKFPLTYGLLAPQTGTYDPHAEDEQFTKGERRALTGKEMVAQAEQRLGYLAYDRKKQQILDSNAKAGESGITQAQTRWLADFRTYLGKQFPGFGTYLASPFDTQKRRDAAILELQSAVKDKTLSGTDAGKGLTQFLGLRDKVIASAKQGGLATPWQAKSARGLRDWLRSGAAWVIQQHPDFAPMWNQIFEHELTVDPKASTP